MTASRRPTAWSALERALAQRRPVRARYHGRERVLCPHALGWKNGRAKVLAYQAGGTTSDGALAQDPRQRWRSLFVDELEDVVLADDRWGSADNYSPTTNGIDDLALSV